MFQLLIVEDEKWEREGLVDFLDWNSFGIEIAGTARDGKEGYEEALRLRPDIILTDIKMPGMDGIDMSKKIKNTLPNTKIIILTGYDDFKYAKEAISFSANAYVLKPFEEDELIPIIRKVVSLCNKEMQKARWEKTIVSQLNESKKAEKINILSDWISGLVNKEDLHKKLQEFNICVNFERLYIIIIFRVFNKENNINLSIRLEPISIFASKHLNEGYLFSLTSPKDDEIIVCYEWDNSTMETLNKLVSFVRNKYKGNIIVGAGQQCSPAKLHVSYNQATEAIKHQLFWGDYDLFTYSDIHKQQESFMVRANEFVVTGDYFSKQLIHAISKLNGKRVFKLIDELFEFVCEIRGASMDFIINFIKNIVNDIYVFIYTIHNDFTKTFLYEKMWNEGTIGELKHKMNIFFESTLAVHKSKLNYDEQTVKKVINIIEEKYMTPLSLRMIAHEVFLSPNYLGNIFKNYTGKRFNDFLCEYRMEKAKEFLKFPGNKVSTVASKVGFQNPSYFCTVFKNTFGIAPGEYQKSNPV